MSNFVRYNNTDQVDAPNLDPGVDPGDPKSLKFAPFFRVHFFPLNTVFG